ncbi:MAG: SET domain-containing protein-lysine N-methyltransferase [Flavobacteriaceae bacterium]|nr:SET domain-containing protein-lysine N-methyltransferase [Flavobacteriaceae bacterium]
MENPRDFTVVKASQVHGRGVFAKKLIPKGTRIFEYKGLRVSKEDLATDLINGLTSMVYVMNLNETTAIDGERGGNDTRFINHSCSPNCEVMYFNEIPYIYAIKEILEGEELNFDYKLGFYEDVKLSPEEKKSRFPCHCGSQDCRGTLLKN